MDLICTDESFADQLVIANADYEVTSGDENLMSITRDITDEKLAPRSLVYAEGSDAGGIIDGVSVDTSKDVDQVTYSGRSWSGMLASKVICPDTGSDHLTVSGDADSIIASIIKRVGLDGLFAASGEASGITVSNYSFERYCNAYEGLQAMLASVSAKLQMAYNGEQKKVVVTAAPKAAVTFDSDTQPGIKMTKSYLRTNHLVCLGTGEGAARVRCDWFADEDGSVSETQTLFGVYEIAETYEQTSSEYDKLKEDGKKKLVELQDSDSVELSIEDSGEHDVGDTVSANEVNYGIEASASITQKRYTEQNSVATFSYEAGEAKQAGVK